MNYASSQKPISKQGESGLPWQDGFPFDWGRGTLVKLVCTRRTSSPRLEKLSRSNHSLSIFQLDTQNIVIKEEKDVQTID